jgi:hypothetical protein
MYSGYLNVQNRNSANATNCGSDLNLPCVMRSGDNVSGICTYTRQMLGWRDTDGNNIFDIADTYPATTLNPLVPNPTYDKTPTFTGSGADVPLTNQNPYPFFHFGPRNNISPNPVTEFWWRVDAGAWVAYPSAFTSFTTSPLPNGAHTFELKARNALGRFDQTPEVQNFTELGHLYSTSSTVTSANSQRRISRDETGVYHVAYSDENIIYYTSSTDNGTTWSTEEVIPAYSFFPKTYPAVATHLSHVFVVWQEYEGVVNGKHQYRIKGVWKQPGSAWRQMMAYGSSNSPLIARFSSPNDPLPTLVAADNTYNERAPTSPPHPELMCAWRNEDGIYSAVGSWDVIPSCCGPGDGEDEILSQEYVWNPNVRFGKIANTSGYCVNPSLGTDFLNRVGLAFDEAGLIYATLNDGAGWSAREQVSIPALTSEPSHYPSATFDNSSRLIVTWKSEDWEFGGQDIEVRRREVSGGWNVITMFGEMHSYYPSVSGYPRLSGNSDFAVAFHTSQNNLQLKKYTNGAWQATQVVAATGFDAMISENNSASLDAKIAFRSTSSSPYAIAFTSQSLPTSPFTTQEDIYREVRVVADSFAIRFALGELVAKTGTASAPVSFDSFDDTTVIRGNTEITRVFRSEPFNVSAGTVLEIFHLLRVANPTWIRNTFGRNSEVALSIEAIDAETGTVLGKPATFSVKKNVIPSLRGNATLPLSPFRGRRIFVRASVQISNDLVTKPYMLEIRKPRSASSSPLARIGEVTSSGKPSNYFLADNFPNPFNPSTKIQFGLPEGAVVSLSVFDVLGCEVQQLATGYYSAGYHTITWNASDLSSGMYFARLRLTDAAGKQFFTKTNRLLLAK